MWYMLFVIGVCCVVVCCVMLFIVMFICSMFCDGGLVMLFILVLF